MRYQHRQHAQTGAVSLFVVIFTAVLFVAISVGFTILMLSDQQEATDNDLAQSALDSANAGTEDAKRVLAQYSDCVERALGTDGLPAPTGGVDCSQLRTALANGDRCNTINAALGNSSDNSERKIQQTEAANDKSSALDQAYTCVKITPDTDTYVGKTRSEGDMRVIPLKTDNQPFDTVRIEWLTRDDMALEAGQTPNFTSLPDYTGAPADSVRLPSRAQWKSDRRGAVLRVGSIQYKPGEVDVNNIDNDARAAFLYSSDSTITGTNAAPIDLSLPSVDMHRPLTNPDTSGFDAATVNRPLEVPCRNAAEGGYFCTTYIRLPNPGDTSYLRYLTLASVYRNTSFQITLLNGTNTVKFRNVQPEIDATGRANNVFRRVVSRVESADASQAPYPRAALGSSGSVCKDFVITDSPDDGDYTDNNLGVAGCATITKPGAVTP